MRDDGDILAALRRRDSEAFAYLFEMYADKIYRLALGLLENETEADGVVQDTFLRFIERLHQFEGRSKVGTWLYRVAYNLCIDRLRKRRPMLTWADDNGDDELSIPLPVDFTDWQQAPQTLFSQAELTTELANAISTLPDKLKAVFILREIEELSTKESAQILGITAGNVKVRLHRARLLLREKLADSFGKPERAS